MLVHHEGETVSNWVKRIASILGSKPTGSSVGFNPHPDNSHPQSEIHSEINSSFAKLMHDVTSDERLQGNNSIILKEANKEITKLKGFETKINATISGLNVEPHQKESFSTNIMDGNKPLMSEGDITMDEQDDNLKALQKLRSLPRGSETQVESRIAAIKNLLGEKEIFKTLQMIRWPKGIVCPRCQSSQIVRRDPPPDTPDKRHYYVCLTCKGEGGVSDFDDFTGLPVGTLQGLRQWMLCWYLIGFCSMSQIARVLGISVHEVTQIASFGSQITEIAHDPDAKKKIEAKEKQEKDRKKSFLDKHQQIVEMQEDYTRSASKQPFKPGYKSKK